MWVGALLVLTAAAVAAPEEESVPPNTAEEDGGDAPERIFMPAIELGVLWHADPALDASVLFRTSVDFRLRRVNAPFVRLTYDAASPRLTQPATPPVQQLTANTALHDVYVGLGIRLGTQTVQFVPTGHIGAQITEVPVALQAPEDGIIIDTETAVTGLAVVGLGTELYVEPEIALTLDVSARARFRRLKGGSPLGAAATIGVTTAF